MYDIRMASLSAEPPNNSLLLLVISIINIWNVMWCIYMYATRAQMILIIRILRDETTQDCWNVRIIPGYPHIKMTRVLSQKRDENCV